MSSTPASASATPSKQQQQTPSKNTNNNNSSSSRQRNRNKNNKNHATPQKSNNGAPSSLPLSPTNGNSTNLIVSPVASKNQNQNNNNNVSPSVGQLFQACQTGKVGEVLETVSSNGGFQFLSGSRQRDHRTPLHQACQWKQPHVVRAILMEAVKNDDQAQKEQKEESTSSVSELLSQVTKSGGQTGLHIACFVGCLEIVKILIEEFNDNFERRDGHKNTPLLIAVREGRRDIVEYLLGLLTKKYPSSASGSLSPELVAFVNLKNADAATAFSCCASNGSAEIAELLLTHGADPALGPVHPLIQASQSGRTQVLKSTITHLMKNDKTFDINQIKQRTGANCLIVSAQEGRNDIVKFLVEEAKADVLATTTQNGFSCLHAATWSNKPETAKIILDSCGNDEEKRQKLISLKSKEEESFSAPGLKKEGKTALEIAVQRKADEKMVFEVLGGNVEQVEEIKKKLEKEEQEEKIHIEKLQKEKEAAAALEAAEKKKKAAAATSSSTTNTTSTTPITPTSSSTPSKKEKKQQQQQQAVITSPSSSADLELKLKNSLDANKNLQESHTKKVQSLESEISSLKSSILRMEKKQQQDQQTSERKYQGEVERLKKELDAAKQEIEEMSKKNQNNEDERVSVEEFEQALAELNQQLARERKNQTLLEEQITNLKNKVAERNLMANDESSSVSRSLNQNQDQNSTTNNSHLSNSRRGSLLHSPTIASPTTKTQNTNTASNNGGENDFVISSPQQQNQQVSLASPSTNTNMITQKELEETTHRLRTQIKELFEKLEKEKSLRRTIETENSRSVESAKKEIEDKNSLEIEKLKAQLKEQQQQNSSSNVATTTIIPSSDEITKAKNNNNSSSKAEDSSTAATIVGLVVPVLTLGLGFGLGKLLGKK